MERCEVVGIPFRKMPSGVWRSMAYHIEVWQHSPTLWEAKYLGPWRPENEALFRTGENFAAVVRGLLVDIAQQRHAAEGVRG